MVITSEQVQNQLALTTINFIPVEYGVKEQRSAKMFVSFEHVLQLRWHRAKFCKRVGQRMVR